MRTHLLIVALAVVIAGCSNPKPKAAPPLELPPGQESAAAMQSPAEKVIDIGDVESSISCELNLAEADRAAGWKVTELRDTRKGLSMVTAELPAAPETMPVTASIHSLAAFADTPVMVRGRLLREVNPGERVEIGTFSLVAGRWAESLPSRGENQPPASWSFNALEGLDTVPESMMLMVETTLVLTPFGTDETALDPETADTAEGFSTVELSNPLRINITPAAS